MDYVKNHLKQLRRLGLINYIFFLIGLIFLIPGIVLALTRMFDAGYALIGVGLFVLAIAFIIYVYLICFGFKIKNYLMNPKSFLVSLFL